MAKCKDIVEQLEKLAPVHLAESWDNVGLLLGDMNQDVHHIMITLDVTSQVVQEAVEKNVDMIISHHPFIFKPLTRIVEKDYTGSMIRKLIKNDIAVYAAHTNLDIVWSGLNDELAKKFELNNVTVLHVSRSKTYKKIVVFVPCGYEDTVRDAMTQAGAGKIGNYSDCSYMVQGTGTYRPLEGTNPFQGTLGKLEKAEESRIETIVPSDKVDQVVQAMLHVHPYEEVAYDVYPLELKGEEIGIGRVGFLKEAVAFSQLIDQVKGKLNLSHIRYVGDATKLVSKVAVCGGGGAGFISDCIAQKVDVYITGDIKYHEAQTAEQNGLCLIDAGHFGTENIVGPLLMDYLKGNLNTEDVQIFCSQDHSNVIKIV